MPPSERRSGVDAELERRVRALINTPVGESLGIDDERTPGRREALSLRGSGGLVVEMDGGHRLVGGDACIERDYKALVAGEDRPAIMLAEPENVSVVRGVLRCASPDSAYLLVDWQLAMQIASGLPEHYRVMAQLIVTGVGTGWYGASSNANQLPTWVPDYACVLVLRRSMHPIHVVNRKQPSIFDVSGVSAWRVKLARWLMENAGVAGAPILEPFGLSHHLASGIILAGRRAMVMAEDPEGLRQSLARNIPSYRVSDDGPGRRTGPAAP